MARRALPPPQDPATIREWDRLAVEEFRMPSILLMENAGGGAARSLLELATREPDVFGPPWIVLCGPGNNGGDGFVVARHLHNAAEEVEVHLAFSIDRLQERKDSTVNLRILERMAVPISAGEEPHPPPDVLRTGASPLSTASAGRRGTVVDALLGTGLSRELRSPYREWVDAVSASGLPVVSLDVPTGLDAATGKVLGAAVRARRTITFAAAKTGFSLREGPAHAGEVHVVGIGMPREIWDR